MKKLLLLSLLVFSTFLTVHAEIVNPSVAEKAAKNHYLTYNEAVNTGLINLNLIYTETANEQPVYYVFNVENNKGFIIVSAEDNVYPILGYAFEGTYQTQTDFDPENFNYWMNNYADQIVYTRNHFLKADELINQTWSELLQANPTVKSIENVDPLLTTTWDQGTYYNQLCPTDPGGPGGHVWAGCVATAMGQVMKYHNYPDQGSGSHSYNCPGYGNQSANFGATTYNWSGMPNQINSSNTNVATLLYHLGISVDMQYSPSGSGAFSSDARDALVEYFNYSDNAQLLPKNAFPIETFVYKLKNELNLNRPVYYSGSGSAGGHAFVCDGYQGDDYFHFNWGWSGYANGYFYLNNLNPGGTQFNQGQSAMFYVYPEGTSVLAGPENFTAEVNGTDVNLLWDAPSGKDLLGYNIYRNNEIIDFVSTTDYMDEGLEQGSYAYYVCVVYDEGESFPSESASIFVGGGTTMVFEEVFDSYTAGGQLACQNGDDWTTWSNAPCGAEDAYISSEVSYSGANSVMVSGTNDVVKVIENYTSGLYKISFYINVPSGFLGYFNTLQLFSGTNSSWGMQVFFNEDGTGSIDGGGEGAASFNYTPDTWMYNEVIIDLNGDWAEYKLDGVSVHGWQWSIGAFGQNSLNQLGGVNFYAWAGKGKASPTYYIDDFMIEEFGPLMLLPPTNFAVNVSFENIQLTWDAPASSDVLGYNIYYSFDGGNFELLDNTTETSFVTEIPGPGLHTYYLTAVYDNGESQPSNTQEVLISGMETFMAEEINIYPNPAGDYLIINTPENTSAIIILSYTGKIIISETAPGTGKSTRMDISGLNAGVYLLVIEKGDQRLIKQFIKK
ncbi:MAG: C10 family peptidase [Bacteroidetes bacterium]|nr:C10 family peptidase [Bacteroidota bacterium]